MPEVQGAAGTLHEVVVSAGDRRTRPLSLYLGRVPLIVSFEPDRGVAGTLVRIRGAGFAATADGNDVTFDGVPALVVAASPVEMAVVVPPPARPQPETIATVLVTRGQDLFGRRPRSLVEGAWVRASSPGPWAGRGGGQTMAPDRARADLRGRRSGRSGRALRVAGARATVNRAAWEPRLSSAQLAIGVALVGAPDLLVRVTPQDAAAYETPPGLPVRGAPPTPIALARHWAALLSDTLVIGTSGGKPTATVGITPATGAAFAQLRAALPWQYGTGLPSARVASLPAELKRRLREAAFRVP
jgi:hypothetical protein